MPSSSASDDKRLESLRSYVDHRRGISEQFVSLEIGGRPGMGVLSLPVGARRKLGWVICHSFGTEQSNLQPLEVSLARALVAEGFPVLRFHARGYGESEAPIEEVGLQSHLTDATDACAALVFGAGVREVGLIGSRFGGAVAALVADRLQASALVAWDPAISGKSYMSSIVRTGLVIEMSVRGRSTLDARDPEELLAEDSVFELQGFPVTRQAYEEISSIHLPGQLVRFGGNALVIQVSRSDRPSPGMARLVDRLRELGGSPTFEVVTDPEAPRFGLPRYHPTGEGSKIDRQERLSASLIERTLAWCATLSAARTQQVVG